MMKGKLGKIDWSEEPVDISEGSTVRYGEWCGNKLTFIYANSIF